MSNLLKRASFALLLVLGLTLGGVVSAQMGGAKEEPKAEEKKEDGSKLPWSIDEVKKSMKAGSSMKIKVETDTNGTKSITWMTTEITEVSDSGYKSKETTIDEKGKQVEGTEVETYEKEWDGLYAEFLNSEAKVSEGKVKVGAGEFNCKIYETKVEKDGAKTQMKVWFIKDKPGFLAKVEYTVEGEGMKISSVITVEEIK